MSPIVTKVLISRFAEKQIERLPRHIQQSLRDWIIAVQGKGIYEVRKTPGFHDEPLKGNLQGQRSVRLNRSYRVFYVETIEGIEVLVIEVNKHEY